MSTQLLKLCVRTIQTAMWTKVGWIDRVWINHTPVADKTRSIAGPDVSKTAWQIKHDCAERFLIKRNIHWCVLGFSNQTCVSASSTCFEARRESSLPSFYRQVHVSPLSWACNLVGNLSWRLYYHMHVCLPLCAINKSRPLRIARVFMQVKKQRCWCQDGVGSTTVGESRGHLSYYSLT